MARIKPTVIHTPNLKKTAAFYQEVGQARAGSYLLEGHSNLEIRKSTISVWRAVIVGMMLCLMVVAGCDVRPFNELLGEDTAEETDTGNDTGNDTDDGGESGSSEQLEITASPAEIVVPPENTPQTVEVTVVNPDPDRTYTFEITTPPTNGATQINENTGSRFSFTYTPNTDFDGSDSLEVTATDDSVPEQSDSITILITGNPG